MLRHLLALALALPTFHSTASAQDAGALTTGSTIRLRAFGGVHLLGKVQNVADDSVVISTDNRGRIAVPYRIVERIDVWHPRASALTGARRGFFVGIAAGFALSAAHAGLSSSDVPIDRSVYFLGGALAGGTILGAVAFRGPYWQQIRIRH